MKKIVIIGSGNVAEALVFALRDTTYNVVQIVARNQKRGEYLAGLARCPYCDHTAELAPADIYILAVTDSVIAEVSQRFDFGNAVVAHTAGSVPIDVLSDKIINRAVLYPLQTFTAGRLVDFSKIPLFIEASTPHALDEIQNLAQKLSNSVRFTSSEQRAQIHLAAVFASNFTNYMYTVAEQILDEENMEFELLKPLIEECALKAVAAPSPRMTQTGPAVRGDDRTLEAHMSMIGDPKLKEIYRLLSESIWETLRKK